MNGNVQHEVAGLVDGPAHVIVESERVSKNSRSKKGKKKKRKENDVDALQSLERNVFAALELDQVLLAVNDRERAILPSGVTQASRRQSSPPSLGQGKRKPGTSFHCPISPVKNLFQ